MKQIDPYWTEYHVPGCGEIHRLKKNAIFISTANTLEHEMEKLKTCYDLRKSGCNFITEAVRNKKDEKGNERRVDIVDLKTGFEFEIETTIERAKRFIGDPKVIVVPVGWSKQDPKWIQAKQK